MKFKAKVIPGGNDLWERTIIFNLKTKGIQYLAE